MGLTETVAALTGFQGRGAGTDSERRAAAWLSHELQAGRRQASLEPFWSRPNWALAQAWHTLLAVAGSLVSVASPKLGGALLLVALLSLVLDVVIGRSPGRRLTLERASQNVVSPPPAGGRSARLIVTANYDAGRMGLVHRPAVRSATARLRTLAKPVALGWEAWLAIGFAWLLVTAILRDGGSSGQGVGVAQLIPTAALVLALAMLLELSSSQYGPSAADNASGVAVVLALARVLDVSPPRNLDVEVVLQGASDGSMIGLARHLRAHRSERRERTEHGAPRTIVLGIGACGAGEPRFWTGDGAMLPLRFVPHLANLVSTAVGPATAIGAQPHTGRGTSPALPGRLAGLPAITIGHLDERGLVPRSHLPTDVTAGFDPTAMDGMVELALTVIDAIDANLEGAGRAGSQTPGSETPGSDEPAPDPPRPARARPT